MWTECRGIPVATTTMDQLHGQAIAVMLRGNESFTHYCKQPFLLELLTRIPDITSCEGLAAKILKGRPFSPRTDQSGVASTTTGTPESANINGLRKLLTESYHYSHLVTNIKITETDYVCRLTRPCNETITCGHSSTTTTTQPEEDMYCHLMAYLRDTETALRYFIKLLWVTVTSSGIAVPDNHHASAAPSSKEKPTFPYVRFYTVTVLYDLTRHFGQVVDRLAAGLNVQH
ncbi:hypothetical protein LSAT2_028456 [Lamellibrachia satsuma]|nr:hypothetical protein LSAT2_028456 [Lamellibrachia satsuma]